MKSLVLACLVAFALPVSAKHLPCTVKAKRLDADIKLQAKVTEPEARAKAIEKVNVSGSTVKSGGLEVEDGCLVYTYDIKVPGRIGVQEVIIDAGNGTILAVEHEGPAKEAAEKAREKLTPGKSK
jgi:uncharacterized membrane protein YkoI